MIVYMTNRSMYSNIHKVYYENSKLQYWYLPEHRRGRIPRNIRIIILINNNYRTAVVLFMKQQRIDRYPSHLYINFK